MKLYRQYVKSFHLVVTIHVSIDSFVMTVAYWSKSDVLFDVSVNSFYDKLTLNNACQHLKFSLLLYSNAFP